MLSRPGITTEVGRLKVTHSPSTRFLSAAGLLRDECGYAAFCEELAGVAWVFSASLASVRSYRSA